MQIKYPKSRAHNKFLQTVIDYINDRYYWKVNFFFSLPNWPINPPENSVGFMWDLPFWRLGNLIQQNHKEYCKFFNIPITSTHTKKYTNFQRTAKKFKFIITASDFQAGIIRNYWGIKPKTVYMCYREKEIKQVLKTDKINKEPEWMERPYCISISRNDWHKGFDRAITYFNNSIIRRTHDLIFIIPNGPMVRTEKEFQSMCGRETRLRIFRALSYTDVIRYIKYADCLLSPTAFEGMNVPPFEAASVKTPFILSLLPVHREYWQCSPDFFDADFFSNIDIKDLTPEFMEINRCPGIDIYNVPLDSPKSWIYLLNNINRVKEHYNKIGWDRIHTFIDNNYSFRAYAERLEKEKIIKKK